MTELRESGEWDLITALQARLGPLPPGWLGIGDDAALTRLPDGVQALTTVDALIECVHFRLDTIPPDALGWKALMVSLSDIAGMGGTPAWAVISLALPPHIERDWVLKLYDGLRDAARAGSCALVGGDTTGSPGPVMLSVTVVGYTRNPLCRHTLMPGDILFATGPLGRSAAGLWCLEHPQQASHLPAEIREAAIAAHTRPHAQLKAGQALGALAYRVSLMDNSDGLGVSVRLLAEASRTGVLLELGDSHLDPVTLAIAGRAGRDPWQWVLEGGEDYHLVGATDATHWGDVKQVLTGVGVHARVVGCATQETGLSLSVNGQSPQPLIATRGYRHF